MIERVPAGQAKPGNKAFSQEEIYIPLRREEPVVQKEGHVTEEVRATKRKQTEKQTVSEQVRKEENCYPMIPAGAAARDMVG